MSPEVYARSDCSSSLRFSRDMTGCWSRCGRAHPALPLVCGPGRPHTTRTTSTEPPQSGQAPAQIGVMERIYHTCATCEQPAHRSRVVLLIGHEQGGLFDGLAGEAATRLSTHAFAPRRNKRHQARWPGRWLRVKRSQLPTPGTSPLPARRRKVSAAVLTCCRAAYGPPIGQ